MKFFRNLKRIFTEELSTKDDNVTPITSAGNGLQVDPNNPSRIILGGVLDRTTNINGNYNPLQLSVDASLNNLSIAGNLNLNGVDTSNGPILYLDGTTVKAKNISSSPTLPSIEQPGDYANHNKPNYWVAVTPTNSGNIVNLDANGADNSIVFYQNRGDGCTVIIWGALYWPDGTITGDGQTISVSKGGWMILVCTGNATWQCVALGGDWTK